ncbi:glycoside hydrolase family 13 protein [Mycena floridula]|nr:glycoside hydrolase family 13 protein [Mycena floridula]
MANTLVKSADLLWWQSAIVYQIYPISFFDSNGDGIGDLNGIHAKLDYLKDLGVDVVWLCPIYRSPLADMGYDISDYRDIDPRYGTLEDWDNLLEGIHQRGMKLMCVSQICFTTSLIHEWFIESKGAKTNNPKRDWYIWRPPKYDEDGNRHPPNNWKSQFQGSAWDYHAATDEYYLHIYVSKQPDLNWENSEVRDALDRGCDGFRMDVINLISKVDGLPDAPIVDPQEEFQPASMYYANGPRVHQRDEQEGPISSVHIFLLHIQADLSADYDIITVGETPFTHSAEELAKYVLPANKELNMVFHFELMDIDSPSKDSGIERSPLIPWPWKVTELKEIIIRWQRYKKDVGFWNAVFIENHDHPRSVSRFGNDSTDELRTLSAKMLAIMQITQGGTLYVYQGEELGLKNFPRSWGIEEYKDVASQNYWNKVLKRRQQESGKDDVDMEDVLDGFQKKARDHSRVPMQWDSSPHSGFTTGTPWMRVNDDFTSWNVSKQLEDPQSVYTLWQQALKFRKQYPALISGPFEPLLESHEEVFAFTRSESILVLINLTGQDVNLVLPDKRVNWGAFRTVFGNYQIPVAPEANGKVHLRQYEAAVYVI